MRKGLTKAIQEGRVHPGNGIDGDFFSPKNNRTLHYRSQLELHWYQLLEKLSKVRAYYVEPVVIEYQWKRRIRRYIPDLRVRYTDGTTELIEIKPERDFFRKDPKNIAKWEAARRWCESRKVPTEFRVVGYKELSA